MNTEQFLDYAAERCREHGTRLTPIRRQVLQRVADQPGYCKAYDLLEQLRPEIASLTPPTIYRALEFLETEGLVHRLDVVNGYVACQQHDHGAQTLFLICPCCGKVAEARSEDSGYFFRKLLADNGFGEAPPHLEVKALCGACQKQGGSCAAEHSHMHPHHS
ncbi:Fur family transcriptional regulator [Amantichitinum ursilacus]|uniref:Zinc uptake regulation protein n=1 Tax=Amantichitinum ursilacus TaxID=857265 RepID=A0A0N0XJ87_9NEIS|nr:transcriptional repressor [Amantichitinum ursilacus]KPC53370.1 Zinc uptake regulation protein [Amantichitinum ursilacus]